MTTFMIEGEWSGYVSTQRRICHREYTTDKKFAEGVRQIHSISYSDGTYLSLFVKEKGRGKRLPTINGYSSLIRDCVREGVCSVNELSSVKKARMQA